MPNVYVEISQKDRDYFASVNSASKFFVGRRVTYLGSCGLMNTRADGPQYDPGAYRGQYGFWADFITPTADCESKRSLICLNTYDRARFTFGFLQYAAHVPDGDFVKFLRCLLTLPQASSYFPELELVDGRIVKNSGGQATPLDTTDSTQALMDYLNPTGNNVDPAEVVQAAKFVHWCMNDPAARDAQVDCGVKHFRAAMCGYGRRYGLDGVPDQVCAVIADIRHQGRARSADILAALNCGGDYAKAETKLLELGADLYKDRVRTLRSSISALVTAGVFGSRKYDVQKGDFV